MSVLTSFIGFFSGLTRRVGRQFTGPLSRVNSPTVSVNFDSAMGVPAFWACTKLLSEAVGGMALKSYEKVDGGFKEKTDYRLWKIINFKPNRYQTRVEFFETIVLNLSTNGNSYCAIERDSQGTPISLLPLMSGSVEVELLSDGEVIYHHYSSNGNVRVFSSKSIWHTKLFGNGLVGLSPLQYAMATLGISIATQGRQTQLAASGGKTNGILMVDRVLDEAKRAAIRKNFQDLTEGPTDQLFVLEANMKFERAALSPQDMQLLETYKFQVQEIGRIFGVPSILINDTNVTAWGSGIEQIMDGFYKLGLRPYLERIEASLKKHLMPESDWEKIYIEFDFESLLRASYKDRVETNSKAIQSGQLTPNEARSDEGRIPIEGGDSLVLNGGLEPVTFFQKPPESTPAPTPAPAPAKT